MSKRILSLASDETIASNKWIASTMTGAKVRNEDAVSLRIQGIAMRVCVADGHWGSGAAKRAAIFWSKLPNFPINQKDSIFFVSKLEDILFKAYGKIDMDEDQDLTPESAFVALELVNNSLRFVSYGDCRIMVVRNRQVVVRNQPKQTWIGAFSHLGLRKRLPLSKALEFQQHQLKCGDTILVFSDGVDECVYGVPTMNDEFFLKAIDRRDLQAIREAIISAVIEHGAEDNASLVIVRV